MQEQLEPDQSAAAQSMPHDSLHQQAIKYLSETHYLLFQMLPSIMNQLIQNKIWDHRDIAYSNFGEYVLDQSHGLGISNNNMLWLLRLSMDTEFQHAAEWGDVLNEVEGSVRTYAKANNIAVKDLDNKLDKVEPAESNITEGIITYLPSRSKSHDGQLIKLRTQDEETYQKVISGELKLKEALPQRVKKVIVPIETVKNKFKNLSNEDRIAFLEWIEQQGKSMVES